MFEAVILGMLQGALEWLPVSSSAATLLVASNILGMDSAVAYTYSLFLHISTFVAPLVVFWSFLRNEWRSLFPLLATATLASVVVGGPIVLLLEGVLVGVGEGLLNIVVGIMLFLTSLALKLQSKQYQHECLAEASLGMKKYLLVGLVQGMAAVPGLSRSALTIAALSILGACPESAVRASYLMSIPVTAIAGLGSLFIGDWGGSMVSPLEALVSVFVGMVTGVLSIRFMMMLAGWLGTRLYLLVLLIGLVSLFWGLVLVFMGI